MGDMTFEAYETGWIQTYSGKALNLVSPDPADICLEDIAWALSGMPRYNAHTKRFYSVAEHCCHVSDFLFQQFGAGSTMDGYRLAWAGLMHDVPEAYMGDPTWPLMQALGPEVRLAYKMMAHRLWQAIRPALSIPANVDIEHEDVKFVDGKILLDERDQLMVSPPRPWKVKGPPLGIVVHGWDPERSRTEWLSRFDRFKAVFA